MTAIEVSNAIAMIGSPTALGGHFPGMDKGPNALRSDGLLDRIRARKGLADVPITDHGDAPIQQGWAADDDPFMKNRQKIIEYMPRLVVHAHRALGGSEATKASPGGPAPRLLVVGGDCTSHAGAMAALKRRYPGSRLAIAWFDAHGDFNIPTTTPSGNVWGMPFAMLCGRGDPLLVAAVSGPTVKEEDAALLGAQVLDEQESRMLARSGVAQFGPGMLATTAGMAALAAWAGAVGAEVDGLYLAIDLDVLDASQGLALQMPEPDGLSLDVAIAATVAGPSPFARFAAVIPIPTTGAGPAASPRTAAIATSRESPSGSGICSARPCEASRTSRSIAR